MKKRLTVSRYVKWAPFSYGRRHRQLGIRKRYHFLPKVVYKRLLYKTLLSSPRAKLCTACFYSKSCCNGHRAASFNIQKQLEKDIYPSFIITSSCLSGWIYDSFLYCPSIELLTNMNACLSNANVL